MGIIGIFGSQPSQQQPPPPPQEQQTTDSDQNVAPTSGTSTSSGTNDNASSNDTGTGSGTSSGQQAYIANSRDGNPLNVPSKATASSVVKAQIDENAARQFAIAAQARARDSALIESIATPREMPELAKPKTAANLPDPLPTAPILKSFSKAV